jgi:integrase
MASVINDPNGRKRIQFVAGDGGRRTIRLGKASVRQAEAIKVKVEQLALAATGVTGVVDDETIKWLGGLNDGIYGKLAAVGLVGQRESMRMGAFLDDYVRGRTDIKPQSAVVLGHTMRNLIAYFGSDKVLREIAEGDADGFRMHLISEGLSEATVRRRIGFCKQFFKAAMRRKLVPMNPFIDLPSASKANEQRQYFLSREDAQRVLDACPDSQWRLIFALARFGGLRTPSETLLLKWSDVDWDRGRLTIHSPKTEHHEGHASREIPLFPELRPHLMEVFEQAEPGTEWIITRYRLNNTNLRTQFGRILRKAGLQVWPKPFQNLRSTRETELTESFPLHVVTTWIGNSKAIAAKHYLQIRDADFERAVMGNSDAAQNAAQHMHAEPCMVSQSATGPAEFDVKRNPATTCESPVDRVGFEPT